MTSPNLEEVKEQILLAIATSTSAEQLRYSVFGNNKLLQQYLQRSPVNFDELKEIMNQVELRLQDLQFNSLKDEELANWNRIRKSIEHENILINHRLTWLLSSQAFLFTAFTLIFNAWNNSLTSASKAGQFFFLNIIALVGILICIFIQRGLNSAEDQIRALDRWWHREFDAESAKYRSWTNKQERETCLNNRYWKHPPLQLFVQYARWHRWITYSVVPTIFLFAWVIILIVIVLDPSIPVLNFLTKSGLLILSYLGVAFLAIVLTVFYYRTRRNPL